MDIKITPSLLNGTVDAPASKSVAHRLLICAALADSPSTITINTVSDDIDATANCLEAIGTKIRVDSKIWTVTPPEKVPEKVTLDCGESGSTLRFMIPVVSALGIDATLTGHGRLPLRTVAPLIDVMQQNGVRADQSFPIHVKGKLLSGHYEMMGNVSSQFTTGLLLALPKCDGESTIELIEPIESKPYIDITISVLKKFGVNVTQNGNKFSVSSSALHGGDFTTEGDWSNSAFWLASGLKIRGLDENSAQGDKQILDILNKFGAKISRQNGTVKADMTNLVATDVSASDIPDLVPVIAAFAATAKGTTKIFNASRLVIKESNRIQSTVDMINNLGGKATATDDGMIIEGVEKLSGGTVDSYNDHRIVMATAVAAQKCKNNVIIKEAQAVNKSYPTFFKDYNSLGGNADVM